MGYVVEFGMAVVDAGARIGLDGRQVLLILFLLALMLAIVGILLFARNRARSEYVPVKDWNDNLRPGVAQEDADFRAATPLRDLIGE